MKRILCAWLPNWNGQRQSRFLDTDPVSDREALVGLARQLGRYSPLVGLEESLQPESILLDVSGLAGLFGGEVALATGVQRAIGQSRWRCRIAIADTVGLAWAAAHFSPQRSPVILSHPESPERLASMPVEALRLPDPTLFLLAEFGLRTVGDLWRLPRSSLTSRLGPELLVRLDQVLGERGEGIIPVAAERTFAAAWEFESPIDQAEVIEAVIGQLCQRLASQLAEAGEGVEELQCEWVVPSAAEGDRRAAEGAHRVTVGFFQPTARQEHLNEMLRLQLAHRRLAAAIHGIRLTATRTSPLTARQGELFGEVSRAEEAAWALLINRLSNRLGRGAVVRAVPRAEAQPELAWRETPVLDGRAGSRRRRLGQARPPSRVAGEGQARGSRPAASRPGERPVFLFRQPVRIAVAVAADGAPQQIDMSGRRHVIVQSVGPERIETGWWRRRGVRRDYYRLVTDRGERYWVFRSLRSGAWYLHGEFA